MNKLLILGLVLLFSFGCLASPVESTNDLDPNILVDITPEEIAGDLSLTHNTYIKDVNYYFKKGHPFLGLNESSHFEALQFKPIPIGQKTGPRVTIVKAGTIEDAESLFAELKAYYFDDCKWGSSACFKPLENRINVGNEMGSVHRSAEWCSTSHNQGCGKNDAYVLFFRRNNFVVLLESYMAFNTGFFGDYENHRDPEASEAEDKLDNYAVLIDEAIH